MKRPDPIKVSKIFGAEVVGSVKHPMTVVSTPSQGGLTMSFDFAQFAREHPGTYRFPFDRSRKHVKHLRDRMLNAAWNLAIKHHGHDGKAMFNFVCRLEEKWETVMKYQREYFIGGPDYVLTDDEWIETLAHGRQTD